LPDGRTYKTTSVMIPRWSPGCFSIGLLDKNLWKTCSAGSNLWHAGCFIQVRLANASPGRREIDRRNPPPDVVGRMWTTPSGTGSPAETRQSPPTARRCPHTSLPLSESFQTPFPRPPASPGGWFLFFRGISPASLPLVATLANSKSATKSARGVLGLALFPSGLDHILHAENDLHQNLYLENYASESLQKSGRAQVHLQMSLSVVRSIG
jgi:hypothetical protein